jgi:hypothetical protein
LSTNPELEIIVALPVKKQKFQNRENLYHEKKEHVTAGFFPCTAADRRILCSGILVGTTTTSTTTYKQD